MSEQEALVAAEYDVYVYKSEDRTWRVDNYGFLRFDVCPHFTAYFSYQEAMAERRAMIKKLIALQTEPN